MANDSNILLRLRLLGREAVRAGFQGAARDMSVLERTGRGVNTVLGLIATGGAAAAIGVGIVGRAVAKMGAETNATQDAQRVSFTALLKSRSAAARMMRDIQQLALDSPILDPSTTGDAVRMLLAYGIGVKKVIPLVRALGDMSAASGKSIVEVMPRAALALGQIEGKGKLQAQEMNQLAESVGLSRKAIRKELGLTAKEFENTFKPGKNIKSERALPAIMRAMVKQARGAADDLAQTTAGRIARGKEVMKLAAGDFTRPFYDAVGRLAGRAGDVLSDIQSSGRIKNFSRGLFTGRGAGTKRFGKDRRAVEGPNADARNVGAKINQTATSLLEKVPWGKIADGAKNVGTAIMDALKPAQPLLENVLIPLFKGVGEGVLGGVVATFKLAVGVVKALATAAGWLGEKLGPGAQRVFRVVGQVIGFVFGPAILGKAAQALGKLGFVFRILMIPGRVLVGILGWVGKALNKVWGAAKWIFQRMPLAGALFRLLGRAISVVVPRFGRLGAAFSKVGEFAGKLWSGVKRVGSKIGDFGSKALDVAKKVRDKLGGAFSWVADRIGQVNAVVATMLTPMREAIGLAKDLGIINDAPDSDVGTTGIEIPTDTGIEKPKKGDGGKKPARREVARRQATRTDLHNHIHLDGREIHSSTVRHEQRLGSVR